MNRQNWNVLVQFCVLQLLDVFTTLVFLALGVGEANPILAYAFRIAPSPVFALLAAKILASAMALWCWQNGRQRLIARANLFFAGLVIWNLIAVLLAATGSTAA